MGSDDLYSAKATFRGFRGQTLYILSRVINDTEKCSYRPEGREDLDIYSKNELRELIQVKFYSNDLTLSDLKPEKESSFLRRSLNSFKDGLNLKISLVSFGPIGPELKNAFRIDGNDRAKIKSKLIGKGYTDDEIRLIFNNIQILKVDEDELEKEIADHLKKSHIGLDPDNGFNLLMNWIYQLSEKAEVIDKLDLVNRLDNVAAFLSERHTFLKEYGNSVKTIEPTEKTKSFEDLEEEFYKGISARYEHILADLDVERPDKLYEIEKKIKDNNIIIIHGASGQGKTTLAYRFLHETYPEVLTYQIISKDRDALAIISTLRAISKSIDDNIAIYIDVEPGDLVWPEIVKELYRYPKFHVFVSIREEDWTRSTLSGADLIPSNVELTLNKEEAEHIYENLISKKPDKQFLDFEDSWLKFGGQGPLLEFTYLVTQGTTLKEKLKDQINRIKKESTETERLDFLRIVSIIGMFGGKTDLRSIKSMIQLKDPLHVIDLFQKEYLIRESENGRYIEPLHPIRSEILVEILSDPILLPFKDDISICISVIDEIDLEIFLLNCFLNYGADKAILDSLNSFTPSTWTGYGLILKSLLWLGIKNYADVNSEIINEAHEKYGSAWQFALFMDLSDASGENPIDFIDNDLFPEEFKNESRSLRNKLQDKEIIYDFLKIWLKNSELPSEDLELDIDWMYAGLSLFWFNRLEIEKEIKLSDMDFDKYFDSLSLDSIADFMLGLYHFEPTSQIIKDFRPKFVERFKKELLVPSIVDDGKRITLNCIIDVTEAERFKDSENFANEKVMERIVLMRKVFPEREEFASKGYGHKVSFLDLDFDDTIKGIPIKNLPLNWLTVVNSNFIGLVEYNYRPDTWEDYVLEVVKTRENSLNVIKKLLKNLKKHFKTRKFVNILELNELSSEWDSLVQNLERTLFPKNVVDPWGFSSENKVQTITENENITELKKIEAVNLKKFTNYKKIHDDFTLHLRNFFNQGSHVIIFKSLIKRKKTNVESIKNELESKGYKTDFNELSVINLFNAYIKLVQFQIEFNNYFKKYVTLKDLQKDEINNYGTLSALWRIFAITDFKLDKQIIQTAKNNFKNEENNIHKEIVKILKKENHDVKLISKYFGNVKENFLIFNVQSASKMDGTLFNMINLIKKEFQGISYTDLKKLFLDLEFPYFRIIILVKDRILLPASFNYPLFRALSTENNPIDIIDLNPSPLEEKIKELDLEIWSDYIPEISEIQKGIKIEELQQLVFHLKQLVDLNLDDLGFDITQNYAEKITGRIEKDFQEVSDFLTFGTKRIDLDLKILKKSGKTISPEIMSEMKDLLELIKETHENLLPEKTNGSGIITFKINLKSIGEWYNRLEKSKKGLYQIYYHYADLLISEY
ncbi:MAG TPA: hypothetical protein PLC38_02980 [Methanobacterium sp.]|nr:MAG: hypothetical protein FGO69_09345 [Methanobacterium sp.]HOI71232.1 hypothetical protein [Methanobacterium sp.]